MKLYNLFYKTENEIVEKKNITKEQVQEFLDNLEAEDRSELKVTQVKDREEEEER